MRIWRHALAGLGQDDGGVDLSTLPLGGETSLPVDVSAPIDLSTLPLSAGSSTGQQSLMASSLTTGCYPADFTGPLPPGSAYCTSPSGQLLNASGQPVATARPGITIPSLNISALPLTSIPPAGQQTLMGSSLAAVQPASNSTMLYIIGAVAVVGILLAMSGGGKRR